VQDHPVIEQLMELRTALEKMKPLDAKLKFQIERLLKVSLEPVAKSCERLRDVGN
jgi:U3 small nucleolar ribonucleoprotein protein LCP5